MSADYGTIFKKSKNVTFHKLRQKEICPPTSEWSEYIVFLCEGT